MTDFVKTGYHAINTGSTGSPVGTKKVTITDRDNTELNVQYQQPLIRNIKERGTDATQALSIAIDTGVVDTSYDYSKLFAGSVDGSVSRMFFGNLDSLYATIHNTHTHITSENWVVDFIFFDLPASVGELNNSDDFYASSVDIDEQGGGGTINLCVVNLSLNGVVTQLLTEVPFTFSGYERVTFTPDALGYTGDYGLEATGSLYNIHEFTSASRKPSGMIAVLRTVPTGTPTAKLRVWTGNSDGYIFGEETVSGGTSFSTGGGGA